VGRDVRGRLQEQATWATLSRILPVLPEAAVTPEQTRDIVSRAVDYGRAVVAAQQCPGLVQSAACQLVALEAELSRYVLAEDIAGLKGARRAAEEKVAELEDLIERMRDDAGPVYESEQQLRDRVRFLEAEREWKPWPPEILDDRYVIFYQPAPHRCFVTNAYSAVRSSTPCFYRELGPLPGDDHA
jgi:hypothetical protein